MHPDLPPASAPLEVDRVEWVPASPESVHVQLYGRWVDRPVTEPLVLLVGAEHRRAAFEALPAPPPGVLAAFAVPNELRSRLAVDIALQIGAHELALPPADPGPLGEADDEPGADVIDRAVLAERRARRAELAEESLSRRAAQAEQTAGTLEAQLANLEERLAGAREERDELEAGLAEAERRLRAAQQREYAEQQLRIEAQDELERRRRGEAGEVAELRSRLQSANHRAEEMAREVDRARRGVAEAQQRAQADRAALRRLESRLREHEDAQSDGEEDRERLAEVERLAAELQVSLAAEREARAAAGAALADLREQAEQRIERLERELAAAASEPRGDAAEAELHQTREILSARSAELERARMDLMRAQADAAALRAAAERHEAALEGERRAFVGQVAAIERHVGGLREQLVGAVGQLRDALDTERAGRLAAEAQLAEARERVSTERAAASEAMAQLAREEARREELEAHVAAALADVRAVRTEEGARAARDAVVRRLVAEVVDTAASLREAFERESRKLEGELTARVSEERRQMAQELQAMEARAADLQGRVHGPGEELAPTEPVEGTPVERELAALRVELERVNSAAQQRLGGAGEAEAVIADLTSAAERLREQAPVLPEDAEEPEPAVAPTAASAQGVPIRPRLVAAGQRSAQAWLADAIGRLAEVDPERAERLVVGLLAVQRLRVSGELVYDLTLTGRATFRVALREGETTVAPVSTPGGRRDVAFRVEGTAAQLAALVAGGVRKRPKGIAVEGSRRRLRRLLKDLRAPLGLPDVARSGAPIEPGLLLAALAAGIDPAWTAGHAFSVAWVVGGEHGGTWTVRVGDGVPRVLDGMPEGGPTAIVQVPQRVLIPLLAGFAPPPGEEASAVGDTGAVTQLRRWFDQVQRLS